MSLFIWFDEYSIRNEEIDNHHKRLFEIFNMLSDSLYDENKIDMVYGLLDELIFYSDYHFKAEEKLMIENNYVDTTMHIARHKYFTESVINFRESDTVCSDELAWNTIKFLGNWLLLHVTKEDSKLAVYF